MLICYVYIVISEVSFYIIHFKKNYDRSIL